MIKLNLINKKWKEIILKNKNYKNKNYLKLFNKLEIYLNN